MGHDVAKSDRLGKRLGAGGADRGDQTLAVGKNQPESDILTEGAGYVDVTEALLGEPGPAPEGQVRDWGIVLAARGMQQQVKALETIHREIQEKKKGLTNY